MGHWEKIVKILWCLLEGGVYLRSGAYQRKYGNSLIWTYCIMFPFESHSQDSRDLNDRKCLGIFFMRTPWIIVLGVNLKFKISSYTHYSTYSRKIFSGLSWMVRRYYIQDYPEYSGSVLWRAKNSLENNVSHFSIDVLINNTV